MEYTLAQLNYFRMCYVAFELIPEGLRTIFKREWDSRYKTTYGKWRETPKNGIDFFNNESTRSQTRNTFYLSKIKNGNTAEWDCSCLFFAILFSDSIRAALSPAVWTDVDILRDIRNDIAHMCETQLAEAEFQTCIGKVINSFNNLGLPVHNVEDIKNQRSFRTEELYDMEKKVQDLKSELVQTKCELEMTITALKDVQSELCSATEENKTLTKEMNLKLASFCTLTSLPPHRIVPRSREVTKIKEKMEELYERNPGTISTIYISGNPGCGKSQLARQVGDEFFRSQSRAEDSLNFVFTLNAESIETLADSYLTLCRHLLVSEYAMTNLETTRKENQSETIQQIKRLLLPKIKKFSHWLIIADNVVTLKLVNALLPQAAMNEWGHGQVLITTQDTTTVPCDSLSSYRLSFSEGMQPDEAVQLLKQVSQIDDGGKAGNVAKVLDYQPLALAAAGYYVQTVVQNGSLNFRWSDYLEQSTGGQHETTDDLLASQSYAYSKTMANAVEMAIERAAESDQVFQHFFLFLSLCSSELIPLEVAVKFVKFRNPILPKELITAKILRSSLVLISANVEAGATYLRLHSIVHEVLKRRADRNPNSNEKDQGMAAAVKTFQSFLQDIKDRNISRTEHPRLRLSLMASHSKCLFKRMSSYLSDCSFPGEITSFVSLNEIGIWLRCLGRACNENGDFNPAKEIFEKELIILRKIFGEDHPSVITSYNNLADVFYNSGQYTDARNLYEKSLILCKKIFGEKHADVATSYSNLGGVYFRVGKFPEAEKFHEKSLMIRRNVYGEASADVATCYSDLGLVHYDSGKYTKAEELLERALMIRKQIFGEEHTDVATSYNNLGLVYFRIGKFARAEEIYEKAVAIYEKMFDKEHADVTASYSNLGLVYYDSGQYIKAKELHEKALLIRKKIFGENHAHVATSYNNLGLVHFKTRQFDQAIEVFEKAVEIFRKIFGEEHADVARSYSNVGLVFHQTGQYNEASEFHQKALVIREKIFGEEHTDVATSYENLGLINSDTGQYPNAKVSHEKALMLRKKIFGEEHADVATSYENLGLVYLNSGEQIKAKEFLEKAMMIRKKISGEEHADVAKSYSSLGIFYNAVGQYTEAEKFHEKALMIREKIFGEKHGDVATSYDNLGLVYLNTEQHAKGKECHEKSMIIRKNILGEELASLLK